MGKKKTIYVVDDDVVYQYATKKVLEKIIEDDVVKVFSDGEEAYNYIFNHITEKEELPDIIFLDLNMPIMDGWEFLERFTDQKDKIPKKPIIYIVSSSNDDADTKRAKKISDVSGYLIKPMFAEEFIKILNKL